MTSKIKCDPNLIKQDHIIVCNFTDAADHMGKVEIYLNTLDRIGKMATFGGAIMGNKRTTVDILSVEHIPGRKKLYASFQKIFIVRIIDNIDGVEVKIDFAVTKEEIYFFAYKPSDGIWRNCDGIDYVMIGKEEDAGFSVSYKGDTTMSLMLGLSVISLALGGLHNEDLDKASWFHTICRHFAEPCRFLNVKQEILTYMTQEEFGVATLQFNKCLKNWSYFSKFWRNHVYKKPMETKEKEQNPEGWTVPDSIKECLPPLPPSTEKVETTENVEKRWKNHLIGWLGQNLLVLKCEKLNDRQMRGGYYVPPEIEVPKFSNVDRTIGDKKQLEQRRQDFWTTKFGEAVELRTIGIWTTLKETAEIILSGDKMMAQLMVDNVDLKFTKNGSLLKCKDFLGKKYEMEEFLFANPRNLK